MNGKRGSVRAAYLALAIFIVLGPAVTQVFGYRTVWIRPWQMYRDVGVGILRGEFVLTRKGEEIGRETPLEFFDLRRYPEINHYRFDKRVRAEEDLARVAEERCEMLEIGVVLGFEGYRGAVQGWAPLSIPDICGAGS